MLPIPDFLPLVLLPLWARLLTWLSAQVYERFLAPHDFLVQLAARLDCAPLEQACASYQHTAGPGAQATHTVPRLVRALLIKYLWQLSLRELEYTIRTNLVVRWFVGYGLCERTPDHSTLERFEQWVNTYHHRTFFDVVLRQIDQEFPEQRRQAQVGDTFAMQANAAKEGLVRLIRHTCQCLLRNLTVAAPAVAAAVTAQLDARALFGAADERAEFYLDAEARRVRLQTTVVAALACVDLVQSQLAAAPALPPAQAQPVAARLAALTKLMADEVAITRDAAGAITRVATLPAKQQGSYRLGSATDPDATYRVHGPGKCELGYNVNVAVNTHFVREIQAATGAQPDAVGLPDLLTAQQAHHDVTPAQLIYDAAAGEAKTRALVAQVTAGQTQLIAPLRPSPTRHDLGPADCTLAADGLTLTCPHGQVSTTAYRAQGGDGRTFRFTAAQCQDCPLWSACRGPKTPAAAAAPASAVPAVVPASAVPAVVPASAVPAAIPASAGPATKPAKPTLRQFFISDYRDELAQARTFNATPEYKAAMKLRPGVERIIAGLTRYNGARRGQRRGLTNADYQAKMNGMAFNLKTWLRLLAQRDRASQPATG